jgi:hypothetical protein
MSFSPVAVFGSFVSKFIHPLFRAKPLLHGTPLHFDLVVKLSEKSIYILQAILHTLLQDFSGGDALLDVERGYVHQVSCPNPHTKPDVNLVSGVMALHPNRVHHVVELCPKCP